MNTSSLETRKETMLNHETRSDDNHSCGFDVQHTGCLNDLGTTDGLAFLFGSSSFPTNPSPSSSLFLEDCGTFPCQKQPHWDRCPSLHFRLGAQRVFVYRASFTMRLSPAMAKQQHRSGKKA